MHCSMVDYRRGLSPHMMRSQAHTSMSALSGNPRSTFSIFSYEHDAPAYTHVIRLQDTTTICEYERKKSVVSRGGRCSVSEHF